MEVEKWKIIIISSEIYLYFILMPCHCEMWLFTIILYHPRIRSGERGEWYDKSVTLTRHFSEHTIHSSSPSAPFVLRHTLIIMALLWYYLVTGGIQSRSNFTFPAAPIQEQPQIIRLTMTLYDTPSRFRKITLPRLISSFILHLVLVL